MRYGEVRSQRCIEGGDIAKVYSKMCIEDVEPLGVSKYATSPRCIENVIAKKCFENMTSQICLEGRGIKKGVLKRVIL